MDITVKQNSPFPITLTVQLLRVNMKDPNIIECLSTSDTIIDNIDSLRVISIELANYNQEQRRLSTLNKEENYLTKRLTNK